MMHPPKLIALDLDGTFLNPSKQISDRNRAAVNAAIKAGIHVVLASGRMHEATSRYTRLLDMAPSNPVISYNGARVSPIKGPIISEYPIDPDVAAYLIDYTDGVGVHLNFYHDDTLYVKEMDRWSDFYFGRTGSVPNPVSDLGKFKGLSPTKLLVVGTCEETDALVAPMKAHFGESLYITKTDDEYLEFMNPAATKGAALAAVAASLGIARENVVAFGDNLNDLPMLKWAGWPIAMANGKPETHALASEIAPPDDEDGVAQVIERMLRDW